MATSSPANRRPLLIESGLLKKIPQMVKSELSRLPPERQAEFLDEFDRKLAGLPAAYLCSLLFCHYGYLGRWGMTCDHVDRIDLHARDCWPYLVDCRSISHAWIGK